MQLVQPRKPRTHDWIDQRSLALSQAIVQKLRAEPGLLLVAKNTLSRWIKQQQPSVPLVMMEWQEILEKRPFEAVLDLMNSFDENARRLRQSSPFAGILNEEERMAIFKKYEAS